MDTVTLIRSAIRRLLAVADARLETELRAGRAARTTTGARASRCVTTTTRQRGRRGYAGPRRDGSAYGAGGPQARCGGDGGGCVAGHRSRSGPRPGHHRRGFRIARHVAKDRVISTVDPKPSMGTRSPRAGSTATRATSGSTRTPRSSLLPRSPGQRRRRWRGSGLDQSCVRGSAVARVWLVTSLSCSVSTVSSGTVAIWALFWSMSLLGFCSARNFTVS